MCSSEKLGTRKSVIIPLNGIFPTKNHPAKKRYPMWMKNGHPPYPDAPCMEYLPTFSPKMAPMYVNIPYMEHLGYGALPRPRLSGLSASQTFWDKGSPSFHLQPATVHPTTSFRAIQGASRPFRADNCKKHVAESGRDREPRDGARRIKHQVWFYVLTIGGEKKTLFHYPVLLLTLNYQN